VLARLNGLNDAIEKLAHKELSADELRYQLRRAELDYQSLMAEFGEKHRQYVAIEMARGMSSDEAVTLSVLDHKTAIVGWAGHVDWQWGYVVRKQGVQWVDMSDLIGQADEAMTVEIESLISGLPGGVRTVALRARGPIAESFMLAASILGLRDPTHTDLSTTYLAELYTRLFGRLEPHLEGVERLIIIAQGWAATLPVEMLLTREPTEEESDMSEWPWLCNRYEISYAPSVTTLDVLCRKRDAETEKRRQRTLFALADPPFSEAQLAQMQSEEKGSATEVALATPSLERDAHSPPLRRVIRFDRTAAPPRLSGTRREAMSLCNLFGAEDSTLLLGPEASERRLFEANASGKLKKYRYIHLATHGLADGERPELSALVLARVPPDKEYDGLLQMREVFHLELNADLVVLSACQTGLGKHVQGEGVVGLSTAFFFAGTPSLVISLWNVSDVSTALLMRRFYANLLAGQTKAAALREAKAWLRNLSRSDLVKLGQKEAWVGELTRGFGKAERAKKGELADDKPFAHPHYWAPFVLMGDPR